MNLGDYVAYTILTGFMFGAVLHVVTWVLTRGSVWLGHMLEGRDL